MKTILTWFKNFKTKNAIAPYLGGEHGAKPYRDWYIMVTTSLLLLVSLIAIYGYVSIKTSDREALSTDTLIDQSIQKIKSGEVTEVAAKIADQEQNFLQLATATTTVMADPSH